MPIKIKQLNNTDTLSEIIEKLNFNLDQIVLNGGGLRGFRGGSGTPGIQGAIGKSGSFIKTGILAPNNTASSLESIKNNFSNLQLGDYYLYLGLSNESNGYLKGNLYRIVESTAPVSSYSDFELQLEGNLRGPAGSASESGGNPSFISTSVERFIKRDTASTELDFVGRPIPKIKPFLPVDSRLTFQNRPLLDKSSEGYLNENPSSIILFESYKDVRVGGQPFGTEGVSIDFLLEDPEFEELGLTSSEILSTRKASINYVYQQTEGSYTLNIRNDYESEGQVGDPDFPSLKGNLNLQSSTSGDFAIDYGRNFTVNLRDSEVKGIVSITSNLSSSIVNEVNESAPNQFINLSQYNFDINSSKATGSLNIKDYEVSVKTLSKNTSNNIIDIPDSFKVESNYLNLLQPSDSTYEFLVFNMQTSAVSSTDQLYSKIIIDERDGLESVIFKSKYNRGSLPQYEDGDNQFLSDYFIKHDLNNGSTSIKSGITNSDSIERSSLYDFGPDALTLKRISGDNTANDNANRLPYIDWRNADGGRALLIGWGTANPPFDEDDNEFSEIRPGAGYDLYFSPIEHSDFKIGFGVNPNISTYRYTFAKGDINIANTAVNGAKRGIYYTESHANNQGFRTAYDANENTFSLDRNNENDIEVDNWISVFDVDRGNGLITFNSNIETASTIKLLNNSIFEFYDDSNNVSIKNKYNPSNNTLEWLNSSDDLLFSISNSGELSLGPSANITGDTNFRDNVSIEGNFTIDGSFAATNDFFIDSDIRTNNANQEIRFNLDNGGINLLKDSDLIFSVEEDVTIVTGSNPINVSFDALTAETIPINNNASTYNFILDADNNRIFADYQTNATSLNASAYQTSFNKVFRVENIASDETLVLGTLDSDPDVRFFRFNGTILSTSSFDTSSNSVFAVNRFENKFYRADKSGNVIETYSLTNWAQIVSENIAIDTDYSIEEIAIDTVNRILIVGLNKISSNAKFIGLYDLSTATYGQNLLLFNLNQTSDDISDLYFDFESRKLYVSFRTSTNYILKQYTYNINKNLSTYNLILFNQKIYRSAGSGTSSTDIDEVRGFVVSDGFNIDIEFNLPSSSGEFLPAGVYLMGVNSSRDTIIYNSINPDIENSYNLGSIYIGNQIQNNESLYSAGSGTIYSTTGNNSYGRINLYDITPGISRNIDTGSHDWYTSFEYGDYVFLINNNDTIYLYEKVYSTFSDPNDINNTRQFVSDLDYLDGESDYKNFDFASPGAATPNAVFYTGDNGRSFRKISYDNDNNYFYGIQFINKFTNNVIGSNDYKITSMSYNESRDKLYVLSTLLSGSTDSPNIIFEYDVNKDTITNQFNFNLNNNIFSASFNSREINGNIVSVGNYIYFKPNDYTVWEDLASVITSNSIQVFDINLGEFLLPENIVDVDINQPFRIAYSDEYDKVYFNTEGGFAQLNADNLSLDKELSVRTYRSGLFRDLFVDGNNLLNISCVNEKNGAEEILSTSNIFFSGRSLVEIDISNPTIPTPIVGKEIPEDLVGSVLDYGIIVKEKYLYLKFKNSNTIRVFDINTFSLLKSINITQNIAGNIQGIGANDNIFVVSVFRENESMDFQTYNISNPANPTFISTQRIEGSFEGNNAGYIDNTGNKIGMDNRYIIHYIRNSSLPFPEVVILNSNTLLEEGTSVLEKPINNIFETSGILSFDLPNDKVYQLRRENISGTGIVSDYIEFDLDLGNFTTTTLDWQLANTIDAGSNISEIIDVTTYNNRLYVFGKNATDGDIDLIEIYDLNNKTFIDSFTINENSSSGRGSILVDPLTETLIIHHRNQIWEYNINTLSLITTFDLSNSYDAIKYLNGYYYGIVRFQIAKYKKTAGTSTSLQNLSPVKTESNTGNGINGILDKNNSILYKINLVNDGDTVELRAYDISGNAIGRLSSEDISITNSDYFIAINMVEINFEDKLIYFLWRRNTTPYSYDFLTYDLENGNLLNITTSNSSGIRRTLNYNSNNSQLAVILSNENVQIYNVYREVALGQFLTENDRKTLSTSNPNIGPIRMGQVDPINGKLYINSDESPQNTKVFNTERTIFEETTQTENQEVSKFEIGIKDDNLTITNILADPDNNLISIDGDGNFDLLEGSIKTSGRTIIDNQGILYPAAINMLNELNIEDNLKGSLRLDGDIIEKTDGDLFVSVTENGSRFKILSDTEFNSDIFLNTDKIDGSAANKDLEVTVGNGNKIRLSRNSEFSFSRRGNTGLNNTTFDYFLDEGRILSFNQTQPAFTSPKEHAFVFNQGIGLIAIQSYDSTYSDVYRLHGFDSNDNIDEYNKIYVDKNDYFTSIHNPHLNDEFTLSLIENNNGTITTKNSAIKIFYSTNPFRIDSDSFASYSNSSAGGESYDADTNPTNGEVYSLSILDNTNINTFASDVTASLATNTIPIVNNKSFDLNSKIAWQKNGNNFAIIVTDNSNYFIQIYNSLNIFVREIQLNSTSEIVDLVYTNDFIGVLHAPNILDIYKNDSTGFRETLLLNQQVSFGNVVFGADSSLLNNEIIITYFEEGDGNIFAKYLTINETITVTELPFAPRNSDPLVDLITQKVNADFDYEIQNEQEESLIRVERETGNVNIDKGGLFVNNTEVIDSSGNLSGLAIPSVTDELFNLANFNLAHESGDTAQDTLANNTQFTNDFIISIDAGNQVGTALFAHSFTANIVSPPSITGAGVIVTSNVTANKISPTQVEVTLSYEVSGTVNGDIVSFDISINSSSSLGTNTGTDIITLNYKNGNGVLPGGTGTGGTGTVANQSFTYSGPSFILGSTDTISNVLVNGTPLSTSDYNRITLENKLVITIPLNINDNIDVIYNTDASELYVYNEDIFIVDNNIDVISDVLVNGSSISNALYTTISPNIVSIIGGNLPLPSTIDISYTIL